MHLRLAKKQGKLRVGNWRPCLIGRQNELHDLIPLLSIEGKVLLTSQKCRKSLPETGGWD